MPEVYVENNLNFKGQSRLGLQDRKGTRLLHRGNVRGIVTLLNRAVNRAWHAVCSPFTLYIGVGYNATCGSCSYL